MSNSYLAIEDNVTQVMDKISAVRDPAERLKILNEIQHFIVKELRKAKRDAAYSARKKFSSRELEEITNIYRKDIDYLVRCYMEDHPAAQRIKHTRIKIGSSVDLRSVGDRRDRTIWKQMDELPEPLDGDELRVMPLLDEPPVSE